MVCNEEAPSGTRRLPVTVESSVSWRTDWVASLRDLAVAALVALPSLVLALMIAHALKHHTEMTDVRHLHASAQAILHGRSPYIPSNPIRLALDSGYPYPPLAAVMFAAFAWLPLIVFEVAYAALQLVSLLISLRLLGVRDWRCYCAAVAGGSTAAALISGNISFFFVIGLALAWRWRNEAWRLAAVTGVLIALKLFLWPLLLWHLARRRRAVTVRAGLIAVLLISGSWLVIGFKGFGQYPSLLRDVSAVWTRRSYSLTALAMSSGATRRLAEVFAVCVCLVLLGLIVRFAQQTGSERESFVLCIALTLAASPIVWTHYFIVLLVPIAIVRPQLSPLWLVPVAYWVLPGQSDGRLWTIVAANALAAVILLRGIGPVASRHALWSTSRSENDVLLVNPAGAGAPDSVM